ncbi:hypothetical protein ABID22_002234 [Pontibacter aydingkolensis]|uniref:Uncharacterized protein n=1 Tax=Pontibacter aydingkolensis TaxID=1911536 RepID=A0ABS7CVK5_9BACT|nr:hypothetical protein [Pontibacter aydingkolensis]MBW7467840.1 hypothetical protein [Pontibacter aydingkolensis]
MSKRMQYTGVKPEAFEEMKNRLKQMGLTLQSNSGNFNEKGVSGKYDYNQEAEILEIDDLKVGFPASMMMNADSLQQRMTELVVQYGGHPANS